MVDKIDNVIKVSLLYDFYGALLTEKQRSVMEMYHEENLTLQEIAEESGITRQAVHNTLKFAEEALNEYEDKLGLVKQFILHKDIFKKIKEAKTLEEAKALVNILEE